MFVKPGPNPLKPGSLLKVRMPHTNLFLSEDGGEVPNNAFWTRRMRQGDVVAAEQPSAAPAAAPAPAPRADAVEVK